MHHVADTRRPHESVPRLVAATRRVDDRGDDTLGAVGLDDEDQQCLRQEPRLEDPSAVFVRDAALTANGATAMGDLTNALDLTK